MWVRHLPGCGPPRVAFAVGRPVGNAVTRNRVRRRLRALLDEPTRAGALAPGAYLVGVQPPVIERSFDELGRALDDAIDRALR